jgi:DNA polymerase I-like protein with 3'-5' exonuclease and polymerase domains
MTLDAFLHKYRLILSTEMKEDVVNLAQFIQEEARQSFNSRSTSGRLSSSKLNLQNLPIKTELGSEIEKKFTGDPK